MTPLSPEEIQENVLKLQKRARSGIIEIPISKVIDVRYTPTRTRLHALVASEEFTQKAFSEPEGTLVYVESGSQGGRLDVLYQIPKSHSRGLPPSTYSNGQYERDTATRMITKIFLPADKVLSGAYLGTLMDLLQNPNIQRRERY